MKCNCGGEINESISRTIFTPCQGEMPLHPCDRCGLLHWGFNGVALFNRDIGSYVYLKDGETVDENGNPTDLENKWQKEGAEA